MEFAEDEYTELKKSSGELKEGVTSIAAILNKHGRGELYFGIKNDGTIIGQEVTEKTLRDISQAISNYIEPRIYPKITEELSGTKKYVKVVFRGSDTPYFAYGRVYKRVADEDKQLSSKEVENMILQKHIYESKWDSEHTGFQIRDADNDAILNFIKQTRKAGRSSVIEDDPEIVLGKLDLLPEGKLSYAAWHLFSNNQPVELQLAVFRGTDKTGFKDIKPPQRGNLFNLLNVAENYVKDKINWRVEFGSDMKRHEIPEIPMPAVREAIVNSFAHRNFNDPKSNEIAIFSDRIEIYNPGTFPEGLTPKDFISGRERSHLRNPKIAEIFYYTRDIDRWGSGLQRIDVECREHNIDYRFDILSNGFLVTFIRPGDHAGSDEEEGGTKGGIKTHETGGTKGGIKGGIKGLILSGELMKLPDRQKDVLLLIAEDNRTSISKVAQELGIVRSVAQKHFDALKSKNIIKRSKGMADSSSDKRGGYWIILTDIEKMGI
jgi:ATP-dependent DNA helicase RecG